MDAGGETLAGPIRGELLGADHLAERARTQARSHELVAGKGRRRAPLLVRLESTRRIFAAAHERLSTAAGADIDVGPAGDWFLDNFHVVQEHIREVRESLPRGYYRELPELAEGPLAGYPRVYDLAITLISHTEGRVDLENVHLFVAAFQQEAPLRIGELWAIPAMLRLGLIENVRRMALRTVQRLDEVEEADRIAARILAASGAGDVGRALNELVTNTPALSPIFVSRFLYQLRLAKESFTPLAWLEQWLADEGLSAEEAASRTTQRLAITQLMMANSITSLRAIARMDWRRFVEAQSRMEAILRDDPSGDYVRMTFSTRDHYRHVVERIAKRTDESEEEVAGIAIGMARAGSNGASSDPVRGHVGSYLIGDDLPELERATGYRPRLKESIHRWVVHHPNMIFVGGVLAGTIVALAAVLWLAGPAARVSWLAIVLVGLIPASDIAVSVMNQLVAAFLPPRVLPKLDLTEGGVPAEFRTAIVIPTLFGSVDAVREALDNLEVQFLANREAHLHFAVLSDFTDAATETQPGDAAILAAAVAGIHALNTRYAGGAQVAFYLFHRPRRWNPQEGVWMGWERKRGKLAEFNRFLRGGARDAFLAVVGEPETLEGVRYVITLDSDTVLPPDAAPLLVGALAHPLNRAVFDPDLGRVVRGYGILQPRVGVSLPSAHRSRFARIYSGHPGVDPYTTAVSDVYQDLYGEGSFTGKGIYDVDAFEQATHGRFPENTLLSHDLIEGSYARAGLATDITVYDDYPAHYLTYSRRKHRWIRGDWQLLKWLTPTVPGPDGPEPNRLSMLSRWKIVDNLRRSTVEIAQVTFLVAGWLLLPGSPLRWTLLGLAAIAAPWIVSLLLAIVRPPLDKSWRAYYSAVGRDAVTSAQQVGLTIVFLVHQAWVSADAIARTLWRLAATHKHLLEWQSFSQTQRTMTAKTAAVWREMTPAVALAVGFGLLVLVKAAMLPGELLVTLGALPVIGLWLASPEIAEAVSGPVNRRERRLPPASRTDALRYALLHWRFFDRFVMAETNWLAPDNFQEDPTPVIAMRTSPTNIGLQLISIASAHDLGFITLDDMTRRLELALRSLERMRRFRGHFYNWYDLHDLRVLEPAYISTVDSGNLAGHLIALRQACIAAIDMPVFGPSSWRGLEAALTLAVDRLRAPEPNETAHHPDVLYALRSAREDLNWARSALAQAMKSPDVANALQEISAPLRSAAEALSTIGAYQGVGAAAEWIEWSARLVDAHRENLGTLRATRLGGRATEPVPEFPTLRQLGAESTPASELMARLEAIANRADDFSMEMDFRFLFDERRKLFSIGYLQASHSLDNSYYDLLASEARLASFLAIAKNDVPVEHWFHLGRTLTHAGGATALVSWSGSMFEYLMPALVMQSFPNTVLDQTYEGAVRRQVSYGAEQGVPWGVSESAYNLRDRHLTYQYRAFGVPDLALKRGLGRDLVVAPYASALAMLVDAEKGLENLRALEAKGALGPYGFRDSLDYTRPDPGSRYAIVRTYMAHHIGMGFVALTNVLTANIWTRRFHADPAVRSAELLLHERIPRRLVLQEAQEVRPEEALPDPDLERPAVRQIDTPDTAQPHVALLGRTPYTIMVSSCGSGYSRYEELAVTRWRADATTDHTGQFCYVKDLTRDHVWSAAHQPVCATAEWYHAFLATDRVTFHRADNGVETRTEIAVVPEDSAEVRRVTVTNNGDAPRELELTSYGEIVLTKPEADRAHPAFANLFVETEWHEWCSAITATRRPRSATERSLWCVHVVDRGGAERVGPVTCETDRARFVGRGRTTRDPIALEGDEPLSGTTGAVLDPIFALRTKVRLAAGQSASIAFTTLVATSREQAFELADRYHDPHAAQRALDLAWTSTQVELRELHITPADSAVYQELAGHLFYSNASLRAPQAELMRNRGGQPLLWASGISGDLPILLAMIDSPEGLPTLRQLFVAHHYLRRRGMMVDFVILNGHPSTYLGELQDRIMQMMFASGDASIVERPGGVYVRKLDQVGPDDLLMLRATARVHLTCDGRSVGRIIESLRTPAERALDDEEATEAKPRGAERQTPLVNRIIRRGMAHAMPSLARSEPPVAAVERKAKPPAPVVVAGPSEGSRYDNGYGALTADGDYEIRVRGDHVPPAPWANVVANPRGGFLVTERGAGFAWAENSQFFRLTPWHNDPVSDPATEALYLQDEEGESLWSATPAPVRNDTTYIVRHGAGSSTFESEHDGIATHLTMGIPEHDPVKISLLRVTNRSGRRRKLTVTAYAEWALGGLREHTQHQVQTSFSADRQAILARNFFEPQFSGEVAFHAMSEKLAAHTADRAEFLGRNGTASAPTALRRRATLRGAAGAATDPCSALQTVLTLKPGETKEIVVILGSATGEEAALASVDRYRDLIRARAAIAGTIAAWNERLSVITVRTPEPSFDVMVNKWTLYQALACRMWGRSALYQSSGAYGFRDQLQDSMAFVYAEPAVAREHIVRSAGRQFLEGDVQHWWHPPLGRGVRTKFSDDLAWLPFVVDHYVRVTGDSSVLDESAPYLMMRLLHEDEHEVYDLPQNSGERGTVYDHCMRALHRACTVGAHGLPLMGIGDWNDGMNRVGVHGKGETVWLAWFLIRTLRSFAEHAEVRGDGAIAARLRGQADAYLAAIEEHGWDGEWYRRAYFDSGAVLGSAANDECRIDAIAQSWSIISGAGRPERQAQSMASFEKYLVREDARLLMLLTPAFDKTPHDPGYIKGYLPGVRENGAQYTHAALWSVLATAMRGDGDRAFELYQMINPLTHADTRESVDIYKVEPYVVAADVYTAKGHLGRGGWTWYTGSASWMYRVGLEAILGFHKRGNELFIEPEIPAAWKEYGIEYRFGKARYSITVQQSSSGESRRLEVQMDGTVLEGAGIPLVDDGASHTVVVRLAV
jgi:cellobiose phosphorylase